MSLPILLITGATGYIGAHVLHQALEAGYRARITARLAKVDSVRLRYPGIDVYGVEDVSTGDYTEALSGVGAVIHIASPLARKTLSPEAILDAAINGSLNILRQAAEAGVRKVVVTSSLITAVRDASLLLSDYTFTQEDWNPVTKEQALSGSLSPIWIYGASKTLAERAVWDFADSHPDIDVTTINPPYCYGPLAPGFHLAKGDLLGLSTVKHFYENVLPTAGSRVVNLEPIQNAGTFPVTVDVRDVANAHILALTAPPTREVGRKRILVGWESFSWKDAVEYLTEARPELRSRLPDMSEVPKLVGAKLDTSRARDVLGITSHTKWSKTVEDTIDALLEVEQQWNA